MRNKRSRTMINAAPSWFIVLLGIIGTLFLFVYPTTAEASIYNMPRLSTASDGATIDSKYTFFPEFSSDTKITTWGSGWSTKNYSNGDATRKFISNDVSQPSADVLKGKIGVTYSHVGQYEGQDIDLKIHIHNWDPYGNQWRETRADGVIRAKVGNIGFQTDKIAVSTQGFQYVDMTWQFVKSGTSTPVNVSGYFTFSDIDISQGIQFSKGSSTDIDRFMVHNKTNKLNYSNINGEYKIYDTRDADVNDYAYLSDYAFTFLYSDSPSFRFKWTTDWASSLRWGSKPETWTFMYNDVHKNAGGEYLFHVKNKPVATTVSAPTKSVSTTGNIKTTDTLKYTIKAVTPTEPSEFYYTSYSITDSFNTALKDVGLVSITDQKGINRTNWFTINKTSNIVTATANSGTLKNPAFYGSVFTLNMSAKLDSATTLSKLGSNATYGIQNYVDLKVNGRTYKSNTVTTTINKRVLTIKHVDEDTNAVLKTETKNVLDGDSYSIPTISTFKTPQNHSYKPVTAGNVTGTISGDKTITIPYEKPRKMTVNYINDDTNATVRSFDSWATTYKSEPSVSETGVGLRYDGTTFNFTAMAKFSYSSVNYKFVKFDATSKPVPTAPTSTTLSSSAAGDAVLNVRYTPSRVFTVKHVDKDDKKVLKTDTTSAFDGEAYSITPTTTFKTVDGLAYRPVSSAVVSGTVKGNMTITIEYEKPRKLTVNHVDNDDSKLLGTETSYLYDGTAYSKSPITTFKTVDGLAYRPLSAAAVKGTISGDQVITIRYEKPRKITFNHVDKDDNKLLGSESVNLYDGATYSKTPSTTFKTADGLSYRPLSTATITGTVNGAITITIKYEKPRKITFNHVDKDDGKLLDSDFVHLYDGESYSKTPFVNKYKTAGGLLYRPVSTAAVTGKVTGAITIIIKYEKPRKITFNHIDKDDNKLLESDFVHLYDGESYSKTPFVNKYKTSDDLFYRPVSATAVNGVVTGDLSITIKYERPRKITFNHIDKDDNKLLGSESVNLYDGQTYSKTPFVNTYKTAENHYYRPVSTTTVTGTVNGAMTITIKYEKPRKVTVKYINDDTGSLIRTTDTWATTYTSEPSIIEDKVGQRYDGTAFTFTSLKEFSIASGERFKFVNYDATSKPTAPTATNPAFTSSAAGDAVIVARYTPARTMTTNHVDNDTGSVIKTTVDKYAVFDGDTYTFKYDNTLKFKMHYSYRLINGMNQTFARTPVKGNSSYDFKYTKPAVDIALKAVTVNTAKASATMPTKIELDIIQLNDRWKDKEVVMTTYIAEKGLGTGTNFSQAGWVITQPVNPKAGTLTNGVTLQLDEQAATAKYYPNGFASASSTFTQGASNPKMAVNKKYDVKVVISGNPSDLADIVISNDNKQIMLPGYTASQKVIKKSSSDKPEVISETAVVQTTKTLTGPVSELKETIEMTLAPTIENAISGYGYDLSQSVKYSTQLALNQQALPTMTAGILVDGALNDGAYPVNGSKGTVALTPTNKDSGLSRTTDYALPKVYVDQQSGDLSLQAKAGYMDGGKLLYVPVWLDALGSYNYTFTTNEIGRNAMVIQSTHTIDVNAYMFGTIDSETFEQDALIIQPESNNLLNGLTDAFKDRD